MHLYKIDNLKRHNSCYTVLYTYLQVTVICVNHTPWEFCCGVRMVYCDYG